MTVASSIPVSEGQDCTAGQVKVTSFFTSLRRPWGTAANAITTLDISDDESSLHHDAPMTPPPSQRRQANNDRMASASGARVARPSRRSQVASDGVAPALLDKLERSTRGGSSHFVGVCYHKATGKWQAMGRAGQKNAYLGLFATEEEAAVARWQRLNGPGCEKLSHTNADAATCQEEQSLLECTAELPCKPDIDSWSTPPQPASLQPALDVVHCQPLSHDSRQEIAEHTIIAPLPPSHMDSLLMVSLLDSEAHESAIDVLPTSEGDANDNSSKSESSKGIERTEMLTRSSAVEQVDVSISTGLARGFVEDMASPQVHNTALECDPILPLRLQESTQRASPSFSKKRKDDDVLLKPPEQQFLKPIVYASPKKQKTGAPSEFSKTQQLKVADVLCTPGRCDTTPPSVGSRPNVISNEFELPSKMESGFLKALAGLDVLKFQRKRLFAADA